MSPFLFYAGGPTGTASTKHTDIEFYGSRLVPGEGESDTEASDIEAFEMRAEDEKLTIMAFLMYVLMVMSVGIFVGLISQMGLVFDHGV